MSSTKSNANYNNNQDHKVGNMHQDKVYQKFIF